MGQEIALDVKDLRITYKCLKSFSIKQSLLKFKKAKTEVYEAVRGVSFSLPKGEILGIVGKMEVANPLCLRLLRVFFHLIQEK